MFMFVDDVCLLSPDGDSLQRNLDVYAAYVRKWRYDLNPDKFKIVPFGTCQQIASAPSLRPKGA